MPVENLLFLRGAGMYFPLFWMKHAISKWIHSDQGLPVNPHIACKLMKPWLPLLLFSPQAPGLLFLPSDVVRFGFWEVLHCTPTPVSLLSWLLCHAHSLPFGREQGSGREACFCVWRVPVIVEHLHIYHKFPHVRTAAHLLSVETL